MTSLSAEQLERVVTAGTYLKPEVLELTTDMPSGAPLLGEDAPPMAFELDGTKVQYFINRAGQRWAREAIPSAPWVELP